MFRKSFDSPVALVILAGASVFLAFPKFNLWPLVLLFPLFAIHLNACVTSVRRAFLAGFWVSCVIMLGGFYWVTYVIHNFGFLPWSVSGLLFAGFCGFGALNFPVSAAVTYAVDRRWGVSQNTRLAPIWWIVVYPAFFTLIEWLIPKLFPWHIGHCLYHTSWLNQIAEVTSTPFLTFLLLSTGAALTVVCYPPAGAVKATRRWLATPAGLTALTIVFSLVRLAQGPAHEKTLRVGVVQANIGTVDKVEAAHGFVNKLHYINALYIRMTDELMSQKPQLIVWPETAMVYHLHTQRDLPLEIESRVKAWNVPLVTGAFATALKNPLTEFNAGYLLEPQPDGTVTYDYYPKNVLLAFGEYMPFGETFPILYRLFPEVSNFEAGKTQRPLVLRDGTRLGVSICYEMIVPSFMRKVAAQGVHVLVNITNDSWFGPTAEPYLHGALSVFRAIEHRVPIVRSTNTGTSFVVDTLGRVSGMTPVYGADSFVEEIGMPGSPPHTIYGLFGDWFVAVCAVVGFVFMIRVKREAIHH
ncbi:MAG: apolipoprotein N-acyltransferase [Deltaproteobacteria bacterium]|nr:apolipoprotein N-acyltransferase [Deltaproteobacteria bacterium]MBI3295238.1 apolipoprotein N-acyltransferase [Deltaproteobacteria bacterium]